MQFEFAKECMKKQAISFSTVQHHAYLKRECLLDVSVLWFVVRCILVALENVASNGTPIMRSEMERL
jgi:hypothetical protein